MLIPTCPVMYLLLALIRVLSVTLSLQPDSLSEMLTARINKESFASALLLTQWHVTGLLTLEH